MKRLLAFNQDLGGFRFVAPLLRRLESDKEGFSVIHACSPRLSEATTRHIESARILMIDDSTPFACASWEKLLEAEGIDAVLCTHGNPKRGNCTTASLVVGARKSRCPTLGFLDHWKWPERFLDDAGLPSYAPDLLGVIDQAHFDAVVSLGVAPERLSIVGHPVLEEISRPAQPLCGPLKAVLVSEIDPRFPGKGIFSREDEIAGLARMFNEQDIALFYRPHPNEDENGLSEILPIDRSSWPEVLGCFGVFLGHDSMLLLEAAVHGRTVIRLPPPEGCLARSVPVSFGLAVERTQDLVRVLSRARRGERGDEPAIGLAGSAERCYALLQRFLSVFPNPPAH